MKILPFVGYDQGTYGYTDLGIQINKAGATGIHSLETCYTISSEIKLSTNSTVIGPKIGFWVVCGVAGGLNMIYYTDFNKGSLVLRPAVGFGLIDFKLVYGYNLKITNSLNSINTNVLELDICLKLFDKEAF